MEYKNNWPTYLQEKKSPAKGLAESGYSGVCVGKANKTEFDFGLEFKTKAEIIKKKAVENQRLSGLLVELLSRVELLTSSLPRMCSTN